MKKLVEFQGKMVSVIGLRGVISDGSWIVDINFGDDKDSNYVLAQCDAPEKPISEKIEDLIEADKKAGNEPKIDHVLISNRYAVILFLEGRINREMLETAEVKGSDLIIKMHLAGAMRKVIIRSELELEHHAATIDKNGKVV